MTWLVLLLIGCPSSQDTEDTDPQDTQWEQCQLDADRDGYCADDPSSDRWDCDDDDYEINPGAQETCNGVDDDCDGEVDQGLPDSDHDGVCDALDTEECDCVDNDGDGLVDEGFGDVDGDGTADCCDEEECDGQDNDGDGISDEGFDEDGDGIGACLDCDDQDAEVFPGQEEDPTNGKDDDCDGLVDETAWSHGDLLIVEIMSHPAWTSDIRGEWIELLNTTTRTLVLDGLYMVDASIDYHQFTGGFSVEPGELAVIAREGDPDFNGGVAVDYVYDGVMMAETDQVGIYIDDPDEGTVLIDEVIWTHQYWPDRFGSSKNLDPDFFDPIDNDDYQSWCDAWERWDEDEPTTDEGSPGEMNPHCPQ